MKKPISDPTILIKPSTALCKLVKDLGSDLSKCNAMSGEHQYLTTKEDLAFINTFDQGSLVNKIKAHKNATLTETDFRINLQNLNLLYEQLQVDNSDLSKRQIYLHELLEESEIILPENIEVPRSQVLEARCQKLRAQQENRRYKAMTKDVDNVCKFQPDDTIGYQLKMINRQLIAIAQFIVSVLAGFAFGFIGVELIIGNLDFGFRLLLGIACALIIAIAELYFLAKKLSEDMYFETTTEQKLGHSKLD